MDSFIECNKCIYNVIFCLFLEQKLVFSFLFQERGSLKLNYIDVVFEPKPCIGKFYIHGADNRTPYADVDFSAKAEPLISSDEDDESSVSGKYNDDDFVSLEDVQQWNITED